MYWIAYRVNPRIEYGTLYSVTAIATNNVWAVGAGSFSGDIAMVTHWDGSSWSQPISLQTGTYSYLTAIMALSASNVWAVGFYGANGTTNTFIEHWNGWSGKAGMQINSPNNGDSFLNGISINRQNGNVWTVGHGGTPSNNITLTEFYN